MSTVGYVLVLVGFVMLRGVSKGRTIVDLPGDMRDALIAALQNDTAAFREVMARTGVALTAATETQPDSVAVGENASAGIVELGKRIQSLGTFYRVSEHPSFGGVTQGAHVDNSDHYKGKAIDVNADGAPGGEKRALDKVASLARSEGFFVLWQVADHFDHVHISDRR